MQTHAWHTRLVSTLLTVAAAVAVLTPQPLTAQTVWDKLKQDAKQAVQQPQQQKPAQQQTSQQQQAGQSPAARYQPVAASQAATASDPDSSCCTDAAMKTIAAQPGPDIVGIKLGMTPAQAAAAIKAHNPALIVYTVNMRLTHPGAKNFVEVPHYIVATNSPPVNGGQRKMVGMEAIILEFTTPPNSPLLAMATRYTNFTPTLASNLMSELDKKYGTPYPREGPRSWVYDSSGKPIATEMRALNLCAGDSFGPLGRQTPDEANGGGFVQGATSGALDVNTFKYQESSVTAPRTDCIPYSMVQTSLPTGINPNMQITEISVMISSGGLNYAAARSTHDWLQAEADALAKAAHDAAAQNKGTTF